MIMNAVVFSLLLRLGPRGLGAFSVLGVVGVCRVGGLFMVHEAIVFASLLAGGLVCWASTLVVVMSESVGVHRANP